MKARRRIPGQIVNPHFNREARRAARAAGGRYDVPEFLDLPIGEIVDDPNCWQLCIDGGPLDPADRECANAVLSALSNKKRTAFLDNLRRQNLPDVRRQMPAGQLEWLDSMLEVFGPAIDELDGSAKRLKPREVDTVAVEDPDELEE